MASNGYVVNKATKQPYFSQGLYSFGDPNPKFNMSFINDLTYKNFLNFSFQFDWVHGSHLYNQTKEWMYRDGIHSDYEKPITINGETGAWTAFYRGVYAQRAFNGTKGLLLRRRFFCTSAQRVGRPRRVPAGQSTGFQKVASGIYRP
ncbi:MAG: hypothetical protein ICV83_14020 [Cytophagales bacterium]|nr:hypothetical protein [Cytophagales bacterium]